MIKITSSFTGLNVLDYSKDQCRTSASDLKGYSPSSCVLYNSSSDTKGPSRYYSAINVDSTYHTLAPSSSNEPKNNFERTTNETCSRFLNTNCNISNSCKFIPAYINSNSSFPFPDMISTKSETLTNKEAYSSYNNYSTSNQSVKHGVQTYTADIFPVPQVTTEGSVTVGNSNQQLLSKSIKVEPNESSYSAKTNATTTSVWCLKNSSSTMSPSLMGLEMKTKGTDVSEVDSKGVLLENRNVSSSNDKSIGNDCGYEETSKSTVINSKFQQTDNVVGKTDSAFASVNVKCEEDEEKSFGTFTKRVVERRNLGYRCTCSPKSAKGSKPMVCEGKKMTTGRTACRRKGPMKVPTSI